MAKIYIAGKNLTRVESVKGQLINNGHEIAYDWITPIIDDIEVFARDVDKAELEATQSADFLVYLWESDQESA